VVGWIVRAPVDADAGGGTNRRTHADADERDEV
jgi:hypothetical protein